MEPVSEAIPIAGDSLGLARRSTSGPACAARRAGRIFGMQN